MIKIHKNNHVCVIAALKNKPAKLKWADEKKKFPSLYRINLSVKNACWTVNLRGKFGSVCVFSLHIFKFKYDFFFCSILLCSGCPKREFYFRKLIERWFWRCNKFNMFPRFSIIVFHSHSLLLSIYQCIALERKVYVQRTTDEKLNTWTLKHKWIWDAYACNRWRYREFPLLSAFLSFTRYPSCSLSFFFFLLVFWGKI